MTLQADLYFSFRSPYSYLAVGRYRKLSQTHAVDIALRPVWPLAVREPDFFERNHPNWLGYTMRDMVRVAEYHGIPFGPPRPDPIVQDVETRKIAVEQPHIERVTRMGQAATRRGAGLAFAAEAARMIWGGQSGWNEPGRLEHALATTGFDTEEVVAEVERDSAGLDAEIADNQNALEAAGHWGVPTLVFDGEPFFGQDRIDMVKWRMEQKGLHTR